MSCSPRIEERAGIMYVMKADLALVFWRQSPRVSPNVKVNSLAVQEVRHKQLN